ncbi:DNA methyltransferase [Longimycelium tulufanense]|uniref:DNA methyltransferase n=1 Tax=Longimycelium tulufanense TaxID=907463 RepID=A0A8J3C9E8_9PSEU|nr:DNA adenine methylase [Longimycelium tulufanense]GGM34857.1 DNA methyltransferase [Longimycelium tulufanense]
MRAPFAYYGGKTTLADRIVSLLPAHAHYVEPFAGSCAVLLAKPPSRMETVNDLDHDLMTFWKVLRDRPAQLIRVCALTPHSRAEHQAAFHPTTDELERARRVWVRLTQGRSGTLRRTGWRHYVNPSGSSASMPSYLAGYVERMAGVAERLSAVSLECRPALEVITAYGAQPDALLYVDPPYLGCTRTSTNYQYEMPSETDHCALAEALRDCRAAVVLSGYPSPLYQRLYADWHVTRIPTATAQGGARSERTEVLWSNRPLGDQPDLWSSRGEVA